MVMSDEHTGCKPNTRMLTSEKVLQPAAHRRPFPQPSFLLRLLPEWVVASPVQQAPTDSQAVDHTNEVAADLILCTIRIHYHCIGQCSNQSRCDSYAQTSPVSQHQPEGKQQDTILHISRCDRSDQCFFGLLIFFGRAGRVRCQFSG
jgi:hypothetical protein